MEKLINQGHFLRNFQHGNVPTFSTILFTSYPNMMLRKSLIRN